MTSKLWPAEKIERLKKLKAEGLSSSQIAAELFGDTTKRNSICGKIWRLGLSKARPEMQGPRSKRPSGWKAWRDKYPGFSGWVDWKVKQAAEAAKKPAEHSYSRSLGWQPHQKRTTEAPMQPVLPLMENAAWIMTHRQPIGFGQLTDKTCKWPVGPVMSKAQWFCGAPIYHDPELGDRVYCKCHCDMGYLKPAGRVYVGRAA